MFDIERFARDYRISLHYPGETDVSRGWVNMTCPFCPFGDHMWHLGFSLSRGLCSCWRCGHKSGPEKLVMGLLDIKWNEASAIVERYRVSAPVIQEKVTKTLSVSLPLGTKPGLGVAHHRYLKGRGFDPDELINSFNLHHTDHLGSPCHHIVVPIYKDNQLVNYVCRDITDKADAKYRLCPNEEAIIQRSHLLYNFDPTLRVGGVVEGVTDCWKLGKGAFATFGTRFSVEQLCLLANSQLEKLFVIYDGDGPGLLQGEVLAKQAASIVPSVEQIILEHGDPAEQDEITVSELKGLLMGQ